MADSDKDILITPQTSQTTDPSIVFSSGATGGDDITLFVTDDGTISTLSFEGSAGQLFSVSNDLTGIIFSVNDISGIPSLEVNADGTVSIAEFDGEVGIGTDTPTHLLHIEGRSTANTATGIFIDSTGDAYLDLRADNTVGGLESNNPYVRFRQDQDAIESVVGFNDNANDALGNTFTGAGANAFTIHNRVASGTIAIGVNGQVALEINDSNAITAVNSGIFTGSGSGLTSLTAANISAGNLGSGVLPYATVTGTASSFKIPFLNTTGTASGNFGLLHDSSANFTYNPSTNTITAGAFSGATAAATVASGNLGSGVLPYATASATASNFKIPYLNTTGTASGNFGLLHDTNATFYYNPSTDTFTVPTASVTNLTVTSGNITLANSADINSTVNENNGIEAGYLGVNSTTGSDGHGLSLYNGYVDGEPTYGMMFAQTATFGSYGNATGDWNTYFTMNSTADRGWAFKVSAGSVVASIENTGYANFPRYYPGDQTTKYMDVTTGYGSVNVAGGGTSSYAGYSINNDITFMSNGSTHGLYNGGSAEWIINSTDNSTTNLYAAGTARVQATTSGGNVVGALTATTRLACTSTTEYFDTQVYSTTGITSSGEFKDHSGTVRDVGFNHVKEITFTVSDTLEDIHAGCIIRKTGVGVLTLTLAADSQFPIGSMCTVLNHGSGGSLIISDGSEAMYIMDGSGTVTDNTGFALAVAGCITIWRQGLSAYYVWGAGIP